MSLLRQKWKVAWDDGEPIEVVSNVDDVIHAVDHVPPESARNKIAIATQIIHSALTRTGKTDMPLAEWTAVLDMYEEITPAGGGNGQGPTRREAKLPELSPSPASPAPRGDRGSTATRGRSKRQNSS